MCRITSTSNRARRSRRPGTPRCAVQCGAVQRSVLTARSRQAAQAHLEHVVLTQAVVSMGQGSPGGAVRDVSQSPCDLPALPLAHVTVAGPAASYGIVTNVPRAVSRGGVSVYTFDRGIVEACKVKPRLLRQRRSAHRRGRESPCDFEAGQVVRICQSTLNQQPAAIVPSPIQISPMGRFETLFY